MIQVGTRISGGPYNQDVGIVTRYEHGATGFIIGAGMRPVSGYVDIVWSSGESRHIPVEIVTSLPYRVHCDRLGTPDEIADLRAQAAMHAAQEKAKQDEAVKAYAVERERLIAAHPELVRVSDACNSLIAAGKNIRKQLAAAFPGVKFGVRSSRFSGGDSLTVSWTDGPTTKQVEAITGRYRGGDFDGMTDSYEYRHNPWIDLFGDAKYVSTSRDYSDATALRTMQAVKADLGGIDQEPTLEQFRNGRLYQIRQSGGCDFSREVNVALSDFSEFPK